MEFGVVSEAVGRKAIKAVEYILSQNWSPDRKRAYLERLFRLTGDSYYMRVFEMTSDLFASQAIKDLGFYDPEGRVPDLAAKTVQNYNLTRDNSAVTTEFYYMVMGEAQSSSFRNAQSLDKHPTITRKINGETCKWCIGLAGTYTDPPSDAFRHHENCNCSFILSGFGSRDGTYIGHVPNRYEKPYQWLEE